MDEPPEASGAGYFNLDAPLLSEASGADYFNLDAPLPSVRSSSPPLRMDAYNERDVDYFGLDDAVVPDRSEGGPP